MAKPGNISSDFSENSKNDEIPPVFSPFYNNPYLKDMQAFYAKELPIPPQDLITPPAILTPFPVLPPSLLFDPRYFFVPEDLLPPKKQIHPPSSSSTTMPPKRTSTSATPIMTSAAIMKLVADIIVVILEEVANITQRLMDQVSDLQQGWSSDQELQKQKTLGLLD
ncbi:hypothetical protein Tco_1561894 [Tanacetum coccineum]